MISQTDVLNARVLIVDDQQANVMLLVQMLRGAGYTCVTSTSNPAEVCALHLKNRYDLILLDLLMPVMDGFEVMAGLKEIETDGYLPVLVLTAQPGEKLRALKSGARDFISKPFDLGEVLIRVFNMIEVRLLHLEMSQLNGRLVSEQRVSELLLLNVLPEPIVERLKSRGKVTEAGLTEVIADRFEEVTVLFADIVEFTKFSQGVSMEVLLSVLNDIFSRFDRIAEERGLERIKTNGESYVVAAGLPVAVADHPDRAAHMALDMIAAMKHFNEQSPHKLNVRIGIDTGPAVAGVIGKQKFRYDLWGDVVSTASRMESHGVTGRIQVTDTTRQRLGSSFVLEKRGAIEVKGKGEMQTWFLNSCSG